MFWGVFGWFLTFWGVFGWILTFVVFRGFDVCSLVIYGNFVFWVCMVGCGVCLWCGLL